MRQTLLLLAVGWLLSLLIHAQPDIPEAVQADVLEAERLESLASTLLDSADFEKAEGAARQAIALRQRLAPDDWLHLGLAHGLLSLALQGRQRLEAAIESMRESIRCFERLSSPDPGQLVEAYGGLGGMLYQKAAYAEARQAFQKAAEILERAGNEASPTLAMVLNNLGAVEETLEEFESAEATYRKALQIREQLFGPDHEEVAVTLNNLAFLLERQGRYGEALLALQRSAEILETRLGPHDPNLALALNNLAALYKRQGRYEEAEGLYQRVKTIFLTSYGEKHEDTAAALGNLGNLYYTQGRFSEAEPNFVSALEILREVAGRHPSTANALNNLADLYRNQGRYREAEDLFRQSLEIYAATLGAESLETVAPRGNLASMYLEQGRYADAEVVFSNLARFTEKTLGGNHPLLATALNNLANVYLEQGRMSDAEDQFRRALKIWKSSYGQDHADVAVATYNLARVHFEARRFEEAEPLIHEALRIRRAVLEPNHPDIAASHDFLADLQLARGNSTAAIANYRTARHLISQSLGPNHPSAAVESGKLGIALLKTGQVAEARTSLQHAVRTLTESGSFPEPLIEYQSALARLEMRDGNSKLAIRLLAAALDEAEKRRSEAGGGEQTRAGFLERVSGEFDLMVNWQLAAGQNETAFDYAERSRARALLDQLSLSGVDLRGSLPPELRANLESREAEARAEVAELQRRIRFVQSRRDLEPSQRLSRISQLGQRLRAADREYDRVYQELKSSSPLWTHLLTNRGETATIDVIRRDLLADGRALLFYQIGAMESCLFVVSAGDPALESFPLRLGSDAEQANVAAGPLTSDKLSRLLGVASDAGMGLMSQLAQFPKLSQLLFQALLPEQAWARIRELDEVVVVPDGLLHYLPFEMLVVRGAAEEAGSVYWLDDGPAVRYASSATTLLNLERRAVNPNGRVLSLSDPRFQMPVEDNPGATESVSTSGNDRGVMGPPLVELPGTARETEHIRKIFPETVALERDRATEANLRNALAEHPAFLHLATHGLVDEKRSGLFSALALTHPSYMSGSSDDGLLQLYEIYDLDLGGVELAVLSACQTNVGRNVGSDGVFALSRGFLAAGARRVIASQWRVDDESTAELIGAFFEELGKGVKAKAPIDYAVLLRRAKRRIREDPRWSSPVYWAPFILVGAR